MSTTTNIIAIGRSRYLFDAIRHLLANGYCFKAIVTDSAYDEYEVKDSDFEHLASECDAEFFRVKAVNNEKLIRIIQDQQIRVAISANWKYMIPKSFLDLFECGILNFHLGNLPDYKGNATANWAIINGEKQITGNIHKMAPELDAGDVVARKVIPLTSETYIADVLKQAQEDVPGLYEDALSKVLAEPNAYEVKGTVHGLRCYPRLPEDGRIEWSQSAERVSRLVRASSRPYQGAFGFVDGEKIVIWRARAVMPEERFLAVPGHVVAVDRAGGSVLVACGDGLLEVQEIERSGQVMAPTAFIRSIRVRFR